MKIKIKPEIKEILVKDIKPWPENPRSIENEALQGLRSSLENFGYVDLLIVNKRNMQIISGHQRFKIIQEESFKKVHCIRNDWSRAMRSLDRKQTLAQIAKRSRLRRDLNRLAHCVYELNEPSAA